MPSQNSLIASSSARTDALAFRGERDYINSSDIMGFLESVFEPSGSHVRLRVDFMKPIRSHVRIISKDQAESSDGGPALAAVSVVSNRGVDCYCVLAEPKSDLPERKQAVRCVASETYSQNGFVANTSSGSTQSFLYDLMSCMKAHWRTHHFRVNKTPVIRRIEITLPFKLTDHVEGFYRPLKFGAQQWTFKERAGSFLPLKIDAFLMEALEK